jgi:hypothetical protein
MVMSRLQSVILVNSVCVLENISFVYHATLIRHREPTTHARCATVAQKLRDRPHLAFAVSQIKREALNDRAPSHDFISHDHHDFHLLQSTYC